MKKCLLSLMRVALLALAALVPGLAFAQTVTQQPVFVAPRTVVDLGNGPTEVLAILGNGAVFTSQSSGVGQTAGGASATLLTLTATPTTVPCVGCILSGTGITSGTTATAYDGGLKVTMSTALSVATSTTVSWGAACPVSSQTTPVQVPQSSLLALIQAAVSPALPFYTQARVCAYGVTGPGMQMVNFAIGAH